MFLLLPFIFGLLIYFILLIIFIFIPVFICTFIHFHF